jgi:isoquinoline 1-oxidoreductase alpha subunit
MIKLEINGQMRTFDVTDDVPLLWALRDVAPMTGTKFGCGMALCGACTVHVDGVATRSCTLPISAVVGKKITTIEGVSATPAGRATQTAWLASDVVQCGYCQSGTNHVSGSPAGEEPQPIRCRHQSGDERQHLPLRSLSAHP